MSWTEGGLKNYVVITDALEVLSALNRSFVVPEPLDLHYNAIPEPNRFIINCKWADLIYKYSVQQLETMRKPKDICLLLNAPPPTPRTIT